MIKTMLRTLGFVTLLFLTGIVREGANGAVNEVPFTLEHGFVIVQAKIKRQLPVEMILATGAEHSTFGAGMIEKYKMPLSYTYDDPKTCNLVDCTFTYSRIPEIIVGELMPISLSMRLGTMNDIHQRLGRWIFGILGADFFKGRVVQFDFNKKVVRFLPPSPDVVANDGTVNVAERLVFPMAYYREHITLPIVENVTFDGRKIRTVLDTGTATVFALSPAAAKLLVKVPPADKGATLQDHLASLRIGEYGMTDVPVSLYAKGMGLDLNLSEFGVIAGTGLLQNFLATFDYRNKVIILVHN